MPFTGSAPNKTFQRTDGTRTGTQTWQDADAAGVDIIATDHDTHDQDIADGISSCLMKDGGNTATSNLPMGGFRHTNVGDATALTNYLSLKQSINQAGSYVLTVGGTANAITLTTGYTVTTYTTGQAFEFVPTASNTGAVTVTVDGLAAKSILRPDGNPLVAGDLTVGTVARIVYTGSLFQLSSASLTAISADVLSRIVKAGSIMAWPHATVPGGWMECDGSTLTTTSYPELFANIGYAYGGSGTSFKIPDYRGRFLRGYDSTATVDVDAASRTNRGDGTTGNSVGTKQADGLAGHTHGPGSLTGTTSSDGAHTHSLAVYLSNKTETTSAGTRYGDGTGSQPGTPASLTTGSNGAHTHTATMSSGITSSTGGNETRPVNTSVKWIILVNPAAASAAGLGVGGLSYQFDTTTTDADPGTGLLRLNNATIASATRIYISETDGFGADVSAFLQWIPVNTVLYIYKVGAPQNFMAFTTTALTVDSGTYNRLTFTYIDHAGTFSASDPLAFVIMPSGATGSAGTNGPNTGYQYTWNTNTADSDPGTGKVKCNNASPQSATYLYISVTNAAGVNMATRLTEWGTSTTSNNKGTIRWLDVTTTDQELSYRITGAITDATSYYKIPVTAGAITGTFVDGNSLAGAFSRTGDAGADGAGSGTVTSVAMTVPSILSVSGSPVTTTGTLAVTLANQSANRVLAGPTTGAAAAPTMRALVNADLPTSGVTASTYHSVTVNAQGIVTGGSNPTNGSDGTYQSAKVTIASGLITSVVAGTLPTVQRFTASGTWTRPSGCRAVRVSGVGPGGGGGGAGTLANASAQGAGGGAGAYGEIWLDVTAIASVAVTITAGGAGGTTSTSVGNAGSTPTSASFGSYLTLSPGSGGAGMTAATTVGTGSAGGSGAGATTSGAPAALIAASTGQSGTNGARISATTGFSGAGGSTPYGGGGKSLVAQGSGSAGTGYGSGGGGGFGNASAAGAGGAGAPSIIIVEEFY